MNLTEQEVLNQSKAAFRQWGKTWDSHAKRNGEVMRKHGTSQKHLLYKGVGKTLLCVANGPSFEDNIDIIKKYRNNIDIACVDKCFGHLMNHGIVPDYVFLADAGINYEKYCKPFNTSCSTLIANVTSNPDWTENWEGKVYFYVNKDNIKTEEIYGEISGCNETIPASSNVGNAVLVFSTQILGYDKYLLVGYDYCWGSDDNYYAFEDSDKRYWMSHITLIDSMGRLVNTSQNLMFSSRWMSDFYNNVLRIKGIRAFNCSGKGILSFPSVNIEKHLREAKERPLNDLDKQRIMNARIEQLVITADMPNREELLNKALKELNISDMIINHIPREVLEWAS